MKIVWEIKSYNTSIDDLKKHCADAVKKNIDTLCVPQWLVSEAAEFLCGKVKVAARIGIAAGDASVQSKYAEAKLALHSGADELYITPGVDMSGDVDVVKTAAGMAPVYVIRESEQADIVGTIKVEQV